MKKSQSSRIWGASLQRDAGVDVDALRETAGPDEHVDDEGIVVVEEEREGPHSIEEEAAIAELN